MIYRGFCNLVSKIKDDTIRESNTNNNYNHSDDCYKLYNISRGELWIESAGGRQYLREGGLYLINGHMIVVHGIDSEFATSWIYFNAHNIIPSNTMYQLPLLTSLPRPIIDVMFDKPL